MNSPTTPKEDEFTNLANASKSEKISALLKNEVRKERLRQRAMDEELDHPIALFTRQKKRSKSVICLTLVLLTIIHGIQIIALYNYNALSGVILTDSINDYVEREYWLSYNQTFNQLDAAEKHLAIRDLIGRSEINVMGSMKDNGFCLSYEGFLVALFNLVVGLFFVYLFIFADIWKVIFATVITRNFPSDPNFKLSLAGAFWLVCLNAGILTWLGVESGFSVVAGHGDFYTVLFNSLSIFIILALDETVLPLLRFFIEDYGHVDIHGELDDERLALITHGGQYHKPGYGQHWVRSLTQGHIALRALAFMNLLVAGTIVIAPLAVTIDYATKTLVRC